MRKNKLSDEQAVLIPTPRIIRIIPAHAQRAYGLFDSKTGTQVKDFVKGNDEQIEFNNLDPNMHYDVGVIEGMGNDKPQFAITWTVPMRDDTDEILKNSNNLPVDFPAAYTILNDEKKPVVQVNRVFDLVDDNKDVVAQAIQLTPGDEKLEFVGMHSFLMVDDTKK